MKTKRKLFYYERRFLFVYTVEWKFKNDFLSPFTVDVNYIADSRRLTTLGDNYFDTLRTDAIMDIEEVVKRHEITLK